jgi:hypothetical protein
MHSAEAAAQQAGAGVVSSYGLRARHAGDRDTSGLGLTTLRNGSGSDDGAGGASGEAFSDAAYRARRAAALKKFKEKRANRCFIKKIRYTSRKQLAEARPRNRGQFVRVVKTEEPGQEEGAALLALAEGVTAQA